MHAVGAQQVAVVRPGRLEGVVDAQVIRRADRAREPAARDVIGGEADQDIVAQPIQPAVPDMDQMRLSAAQDQRGEGAGHPLERRIGAADRADPAMDRFEAAGAGALHGLQPVLSEIAVDEAAHGKLSRDPAATRATDPVGNGGDQPRMRLARRRAREGSEILVALAPADGRRETGPDIEPALPGKGPRQRRRGSAWAHEVVIPLGIHCSVLKHLHL